MSKRWQRESTSGGGGAGPGRPAAAPAAGSGVEPTATFTAGIPKQELRSLAAATARAPGASGLPCTSPLRHGVTDSFGPLSASVWRGFAFAFDVAGRGFAGTWQQQPGVPVSGQTLVGPLLFLLGAFAGGVGRQRSQGALLAGQAQTTWGAPANTIVAAVDQTMPARAIRRSRFTNPLLACLI
jgi:hypothetical protein